MTTDNPSEPKPRPEAADLDTFLEQKEQLDALFREKFTKRLTVMFTDLKGSTSIAESHGDLTTRLLIKHHNEIVFPIIQDNRGVLVKTIGDGTLSYFEQAQDAVRAAVQIQQALDEFNLTKKISTPILMRIGMHTGECILEKNDIFGDVVNTASRFESAANAGEIYLSEDTYNALSDKTEIYCRFLKQVTLKGKKEPFDAYKAYWSKEEIALDKSGETSGQTPAAHPQPGTSRLKLALMVLIPILAVLLYVLFGKMGGNPEREATRSITHSTPETVQPSK